jgi:effector-binding domain-containing protein
MAVETPEYEVLTHDGSFELRRYAEHLTANVRVRARDYGRAMNVGFDPLGDYIFGNNHASDRIAMTVPVTAQHDEDEYQVSFTMPSGYSMDSIPQPNNAAVSIASVPAHLAAVAEFGGRLSADGAARVQAELASWIERQGLTAVSEPIVAQYDPPWKPGFVRHNEIMVAVEQA